MPLATARVGIPLEVMHRRLDFSYFMMRKTTSRWGVHSMLYASDPWGVIDGAVVEYVPAGPSRSAARSFVRQAREYFAAAERASAVETQPVLYYYSFLNLAKVLAMTRGRPNLIGRAVHGVAPVGGSGHAINTAELQLTRSRPGYISVLDEVYRSIHGGPVPVTHIAIAELVAQSVVGHRLWREAANRRERFLTVDHTRLLHNTATKQLWMTLYVPADTMSVRGRSINGTLQEAGLSPNFRVVTNQMFGDRSYRSFEQVHPVSYGDRPSDKIMELVAMVRPLLWQTITSSPPYRRYYLYLSPPTERRVPQWLAIYCIMFWLGSLTRYQPVELIALFDGPFGAFLREFLVTQPQQLLYMLTSDIKRQDVARAAVV